MFNYEYYILFDSDEVMENITDKDREYGRWLKEMIPSIIKDYTRHKVFYNEKFNIIITNDTIDKDVINNLWNEKKILLKNKTHDIKKCLLNAYYQSIIDDKKDIAIEINNILMEL